MCLVNLISIPEDGGHYLVTKVNIFLTLMYLKKGRIMFNDVNDNDDDLYRMQMRAFVCYKKMLFHGFWLVSMILQGSFMIVPDPECLPKIHFSQTVPN